MKAVEEEAKSDFKQCTFSSLAKPKVLKLTIGLSSILSVCFVRAMAYVFILNIDCPITILQGIQDCIPYISMSPINKQTQESSIYQYDWINSCQHDLDLFIMSIIPKLVRIILILLYSPT